ncbi:hypothetical protein K435DRAFT_850545 [Dendrothele bispora CBS 962.96]|uniref:A-kinase anchor protein 7-like phosphoesterase domain-containing protein n=1 Tax=Dendrothele bispora (strain CBS 962.96) TaxID=1314807 RepID=A0A4S8MPA8_DENBC|nr:hypothetical protein K435DRAFT_850545 [Dendrothele bispora CBS 962.96]
MSSEQPLAHTSTRGRGHRGAHTEGARGTGRGGRGGERGRGRGSRRGGRGGRGGYPENPGSNSRNANQPRPTHFLALPLGQHSTLRNRVGRFQSSLLHAPNAIRGLDPTIVVNPRRLHFTLGVMALQLDDDQVEPRISDDGGSQSRKTVQSALALLQSLQPQLRSEGALDAPLELMGAFEAREGARVLWVSPLQTDREGDSDEVKERRRKLARVSNLVHKTFKEAGYITDTRPLKMHCTMINTSYRRGPTAKRGELFSYDDVLASDALQSIRPKTGPGNTAILPASKSLSPEARKESDRTIEISLGTYTVPEIQLCIMGSHGPEDEYVSVGGVSLV